jgi:hypothetical protein
MNKRAYLAGYFTKQAAALDLFQAGSEAIKGAKTLQKGVRIAKGGANFGDKTSLGLDAVKYGTKALDYAGSKLPAAAKYVEPVVSGIKDAAPYFKVGGAVAGYAGLAANEAKQMFTDPETGEYSVGNTSSAAPTDEERRIYAKNVKEGHPEKNTGGKVDYESTLDIGKNLAGNAENVIDKLDKDPTQGGIEGLMNPMGVINATVKTGYDTAKAGYDAATAGSKGAGSTGGQRMKDLADNAKAKIAQLQKDRAARPQK